MLLNPISTSNRQQQQLHQYNHSTHILQNPFSGDIFHVFQPHEQRKATSFWRERILSLFLFLYSRAFTIPPSSLPLINLDGTETEQSFPVIFVRCRGRLAAAAAEWRLLRIIEIQYLCEKLSHSTSSLPGSSLPGKANRGCPHPIIESGGALICSRALSHSVGVCLQVCMCLLGKFEITGKMQLTTERVLPRCL